MPVERVRRERPHDESWRADAFAASRHSRLIDELQLPLDDHDLGRAGRVCAEATRLVLRDFAPALMLMAAGARRRVQALTAYALTLFDFVRQSGLEGDRLAAINRWEFELESALDGKPAGQPVFVLLSATELEESWPRAAFDRLHTVARRRCVVSRPATRPAAEREAEELGAILAWLLLGVDPAREAIQFVAALIRLRCLLDLGEDLRRHRARLPVSELGDQWDPGAEIEGRVGEVVGQECLRLRPVLESTEIREAVPPEFGAAARYARLTALRLLQRTEEVGAGVLETSPGIGLLDRVVTLVRARWLAS